MNESERKEILQRLVTRVSTGLLFVELDYLSRHKTPDAAWIRNIYILITFYTELLFKAIYIINNDFKDLSDLDNRLRKLGHNLKEIGTQINKEGANNFGIEHVSLKNKEYFVETDVGSFYVKDFNDIRYDFIEGKIRTLHGNEHELFKDQIEMMLKINNKLKSLAWEQDISSFVR